MLEPSGDMMMQVKKRRGPKLRKLRRFEPRRRMHKHASLPISTTYNGQWRYSNRSNCKNSASGSTNATRTIVSNLHGINMGSGCGMRCQFTSAGLIVFSWYLPQPVLQILLSGLCPETSGCNTMPPSMSRITHASNVHRMYKGDALPGPWTGARMAIFCSTHT